MSASAPAAHIAVMVRELQRNLPYTRLFGAQFVDDEDTAPFRRVKLRERALELPDRLLLVDRS